MGIIRVGGWRQLLVLLVCLAPGAAAATVEDDFARAPQIGAKAPRRIVFGQQDLAACLSDVSATTCVLQASIKIDPAAWRAQFANTSGAAVITPARTNITLTSGTGSGKDAAAPEDSILQIPKLQRLDWSGLSGAIALQPGTRLRVTNLDMGNFSLKSDYVYSPHTPFQSVGSGVSIWPTINGAPNTTFVGLNISGSYYNPSPTDDCPRYVEKTLSFLIQSFGSGNISVVSPTAVLIAGPIRISVGVFNGSTGEPAGNATAVYRYTTVVCVERPDATASAGGGISAGALAAAVAVPVAAVLLASGLLLLWMKRRRRRRRRPAAALVPAASKAAADDVEKGRPVSNGGARDVQAVKDVAVLPATATHDSAMHSAVASSDTVPLAYSVSLPRTIAYSPGSLAKSSTLATNPASLAQSSMGTDAFATGLTASGAGTSRTADSSTESMSALLKARSDAVLLKDIKLGPLIGSGSFGRVFRGRWKATPVAVKIIEHYSSTDGVGSSRGNRISAGRELLFATSISHPNVVTTFHISTFSEAQRKALAGPAGAAASTAAAQEPPDARRLSNLSNLSNSSSGSNSSSRAAGREAQLCSTWIVMEYCPKGSLEKALKQGKMKRPDSQPDMPTILKVLLDIASGLDYLHSIGVVHGDLKTANVLLKGGQDQRGICCKITDFGMSRVLDMNASHISTGTHGTVVYMPKELLLAGRMTPATDIYSFGLMMWELYAGQRVFDSEEGMSIGQMFYLIAYQDWRPEIPPDCPSGYAELMVSCWDGEPTQRPTAQQVLRRLQTLQGQARQEAVAARKARTAAADSAAAAVAAQPHHIAAEPVESESEAAVAAQHLRQLRQRAAEADAAADSQPYQGRQLQDSQHMQQPSTLVTPPAPPAAAAEPARLASPFAAPSTAAAAAEGMAPSPAEANSSCDPEPPQQQMRAQQQQKRQDSWTPVESRSATEEQLQAVQLALAHGQLEQLLPTPQQHEEPQAWAAGSTAVGPLTALSSVQLQTLGWVQQHTGAPAGAPAGVGDFFGGGAAAFAGVLPSLADAQLQQLQQQHVRGAVTNMRPVDVGFVSPYGNEFAGCLVDFNSGADIEPDSTMAAYLAALDAGSRAAAGQGY